MQSKLLLFNTKGTSTQMLGFTPEKIIRTGGIITVGLVVFAESGLMAGFFLPGDSLLFTAGFFASQGFLNIHALTLVCFLAAVAGDSVGYAFGAKMGSRLLKRKDGRIFKKKYIIEAEKFYEKHGKKTIILARFTPIVRTFAPIVAGIGSMNYRTFISYNIIGAALWAVGLPYSGYLLGNALPWTKDYLEPMILLIVFISLLPGIYHALKEESVRDKIRQILPLTVAHIKKIINKK
jgi:membrane-associated protein